MRKATILFFALALLGAGSALAQEVDYNLVVPQSEAYEAPYSIGNGEGGGVHSGARAVTGPFDLDGDGLQEVLLTDYSGGGRVHVIENTGADAWELVYSTPWQDSTASVSNARYAYGADLDGDGMGEILFVAGHGYSETNPNIENLPLGLYIFEYTGTDNDYGEAATSVLEFRSDVAGETPSALSEQFSVVDVDGDDVQELLFPSNSTNDFDIFYIYSVVGDIGSGFETYNLEAELNPRSDGATYGGGSPYGFLPADLDGDGTYELSLHSWNYFNFFNADVTGADTYVFPAAGSPNTHLAATNPDDHVSLFSGVVVDIDGNGDDEIFYPNFYTGNVSLLNYEAGEDVLQITTDQFKLGLIEGLTGLGITAGDLDGDGNMELIASGPSYGASAYENGDAPAFVRIAEYTGGDVEDAASYSVTELEIFEPSDTLGINFDYVIRDSAGVITEYYENTSYSGKDRAGGHPGQGPVFVSKLANLGDVDNDGADEVALAFQGVDDSTYVIQETFNPADSTYTREIVERRAVENRIFLRIISGEGLSVAIEDQPVIVPDDYKLSQNYPNPFNPTTTFSFTLPIEKNVSVKVYDVAGRLVKTLVDNQAFARGTYDVTWDGTNEAGAAVASGTYLYTLEYGNFRQSRTMALVK